MASLKKQAEDLGIKVDARWSDETIQRKIDEAKAAPFGGKGDHDALLREKRRVMARTKRQISRRSAGMATNRDTSPWALRIYGVID